MQTLKIRALVPIAIMLSGGLASAQPNPEQIALLKWFPAYESATFGIGSSNGVAFDGANMWVANGLTDTVTELQAATGKVLGTYAVGLYPTAVAFDGANIWVANNQSNSVSKLEASSGNVVGTYTVGTLPVALAFDGGNIWVANSNGDAVTKIQAATGSVVGTYHAGANPSGLAFELLREQGHQGAGFDRRRAREVLCR
jgi:DNA-binding beta-propeller fold protein YncE